MIKEGTFGTIEAVSLAILFLISKLFYTSIRTLIKATGTSAWYVTLLSCAVSILLFLLVCRLMERFPNYDLVKIFDVVMGKIIGKIFSLIFIAYFIFYAGANMREFVEMLKAYVLPYTPPSEIIFVFLLVVAAYAYAGIDVIARMSYIDVVLVLVGLIIIFLLPYKIYDFNNFAPLGGNGMKPAIITGVLRASAYSDIIFLAFISNCLNGQKQLKKVGLISLSITGIIISLSIICSILALEYPQSSENLSALFQVSRIIHISRFFQRVESIFIFIWVVASLVNVSTAFYIAMSIFCKAFNVPKHRPIILPFIYFTFMISLMPKNLTETAEIYVRFLRQYSLFITYLIPILVLIVSLIRRKKGGECSQ